MATSDKLRLSKKDPRREAILEEADAFARYTGLSGHSLLRFRLLAEETVSMVEAIVGDFEGTVQYRKRGNEYTVRLSADTSIDPRKRRELLSVSSSGRNEAATGIMDKVSNVFQSLMAPRSDASEEADLIGAGMVSAYYMGMGMSTEEAGFWSLAQYKAALQARRERENAEEISEAWDELEKSVVANLADDVRVGIRAGNVIMDVIRRF